MSVGPTVRAALAAATRNLEPVSDTARLDAELLMAHALGVSREVMLLGRLDEAAPAGFAMLADRRGAGEPVAYITGRRQFWTLDLSVTPDVLIPRPDSETLIEAAVAARAPGAALRILDLGTGSGALLLAALDHWQVAGGLGVDRSAAAIRIAALNARQSGVGGRASFIVGDWAQSISGSFDLIFCNPPYIEEGAELPRDVARYEPPSALFAGEDGLDDYRRLIPQLARVLAPDGVAFVEIGWRQAAAVSGLAASVGMLAGIRRDLGGRDRCVILTLK